MPSTPDVNGLAAQRLGRFYAGEPQTTHPTDPGDVVLQVMYEISGIAQGRWTGGAHLASALSVDATTGVPTNVTAFFAALARLKVDFRAYVVSYATSNQTFPTDAEILTWLAAWT